MTECDIEPALVIGASGFIGSRVVAALSEGGANDVVAGIHRKPLSIADGPNVRAVELDLMDEATVRRAMFGRKVVINCSHLPQGISNARRATEIILGASQSEGVSRIIHLSSAAAFGSASGAVTEATVPCTPLSAYGLEKLAAEEKYREAASESLKIAVLRPTLVYGPGGEEWTSKYIQAARDGKLRNLRSEGAGTANLVFIEDVANFCKRLCNLNIENYSCIIVNGDDCLSFNGYFDLISRKVSGRDAPLREVPRWAWEARRLLRSAGRKAQGAQLLQFLNKSVEDDAFDRYFKIVHYDNTLAKSLGFHANTNVESGISHCFE